MTEERLNSAETSLAYHEQQIQDLSDLVREQGREIDLLKKLLDKTLSRVEDIESSASDKDGKSTVTEMAAAEKPPHY